MRDALPALAESWHFVLEATSVLKTGRATPDFATELSSIYDHQEFWNCFLGVTVAFMPA